MFQLLYGLVDGTNTGREGAKNNNNSRSNNNNNNNNNNNKTNLLTYRFSSEGGFRMRAELPRVDPVVD